MFSCAATGIDCGLPQAMYMFSMSLFPGRGIGRMLVRGTV